MPIKFTNDCHVSALPGISNFMLHQIPGMAWLGKPDFKHGQTKNKSAIHNKV